MYSKIAGIYLQDVQGKKLIDIDILVTSRNGYIKIMQSIRVTSRPPLRIRKWNPFSSSDKDLPK